MAYFTVKRDIAPLSIGIERKEIKKLRFGFTSFIDTETTFLGWATNVNLEPVTRFWLSNCLSYRLERKSHAEIRKLAPNVSTKLFDLELPKPQLSAEEPLMISTYLKTVDKDGVVLARCTNWPQPYRYLNMSKPTLDISVHGDRITVKSDVPVEGLAFYVEDVDAVEFEDNLLDLVPGDQQVVVANGLNGRAVTRRYYGMD